MGTRVFRYVLLLALLVSVALTAGAGARAQEEAGCEGVEDYMRSVRTLQIAYDNATNAFSSTDVEEWTPEELAAATGAAATLISGLESITPPPAAEGLHAALIESFTTWSEMLEAISESGIFGALTFLDRFEEMGANIDEAGLEFEMACNVAFVDHDDDGTPELGLGIAATPVSGTGIDPSAPAGSFQNPVPIGEPTNVGGGWEITVVSVTPDSTEAVLAENTFNDPPEQGRQFFVAEVQVTNIGSSTDTFDGNFRLRANGQTTEYDYRPFADRCGVVANEWEEVPIAPGESVTANACWSVRAEDAPYLKLFDVDAITETRVYFSLVPQEGQGSPVASPVG
jgi:hypothetical protein